MIKEQTLIFQFALTGGVATVTASQKIHSNSYL